MPRNLKQKQASDNKTNAIATATIAAPASNEHRYRAVALIANYGSTPTGGLLTLTTGARTIMQIPMSAQPFAFTAEELAAIRGDAGQNLSAALAAGGAAVVGGIYIAAVLEGA